MRIAEILATKGPAVTTIPGEATVAVAVSTLAFHGIGALVVSADGVHVEGIVSERDIVRLLDVEPVGLLERPVRSVMSSPVHTCSADVDIDVVMALMTDERIRHVPVLEDGILRGIVSIGDVVKATIAQLERDRRLLEEYIGAR